MKTIERTIAEMTRDFTKIAPRSKSEVRRRIEELVERVTYDTIKRTVTNRL